MRSKYDAIGHELAEWAASSSFEDLPEAVVREASRMWHDSLGVAIRGTREAEWEMVERALTPPSPGPAPGLARVLGSDSWRPPRDAALLNGTAAMVLELDDGYSPGGVHPSPPTFPAVLASMDVDTEQSFERFLHAYVVGAEIVCRLARAAHPRSLNRGFHITPVTGVIGATVGCGLVRGFNAEQLLNAMGIAGSFAGGLFEFVNGGASVKRVHAGKAASDAIIAADLAKAGITGPPTVLEGSSGLLAAFSGAEADQISSVTDGLGSEWAITSTYMKMYPCARHSHAPVDLIFEILAEHPTVHFENVERIDIETYATATKLDYFGATNRLDAQMSMPYAVAAAMVYERLGLSEFQETARTDPRVAQLASRITIRSLPEFDAVYPGRRPARVTVSMLDGAQFVREVEGPRGEPYFPLTDEQVEEKFVMLVTDVVGPDRARAACQQLREVVDWKSMNAALDTFVR